jgi:hypothetical protein
MQGQYRHICSLGNIVVEGSLPRSITRDSGIVCNTLEGKSPRLGQLPGTKYDLRSPLSQPKAKWPSRRSEEGAGARSPSLLNRIYLGVTIRVMQITPLCDLYDPDLIADPLSLLPPGPSAWFESPM